MSTASIHLAACMILENVLLIMKYLHVNQVVSESPGAQLSSYNNPIKKKI